MKSELRKHYRSLRTSFSPDQFAQWNLAIAEHLCALSWPPGSIIAAYRAMPGEADPRGIFSQNWRFVFPKILSPESMEFREVHPFSETAFTSGPMGILEPLATCPLVPSSQIQGCLIPLLAFDKRGTRLGQGGGYYDRFLQGFSGKKIGIGFDWQLSPVDLPQEPHDIHLDMVVTDKGMRSF